MRYDEHGHVRITPRQLHKMAFDSPDALINHWLMRGTPWGFATSDRYAQFVEYLADRTGIHPHHFLFRGSTKVGFSISPNRDEIKIWRRFGQGSDLDLAITDPHFFTTVDEQVRQWDRRPENRQRISEYRSTESKLYWNRIKQKGRHDCYRFFDLPSNLACMAQLDEVLEQAPVAECCVHPFAQFKAFVFRDRWSVHRRYHTDLNDLRRELTARVSPLPPGPDEPLPATGV